MISVKTKTNINKIEAYLKRVKDTKKIIPILEKYGEQGVSLLSSATPVDSSKTAKSWSYTITQERGKYIIQFKNSNVVKGVNIAIILQYGHGTRNGGFIQGRDYINPAIKKTFDEMQKELVKEVGRL